MRGSEEKDERHEEIEKERERERDRAKEVREYVSRCVIVGEKESEIFGWRNYDSRERDISDG